jgi:hypothetical protein
MGRAFFPRFLTDGPRPVRGKPSRPVSPRPGWSYLPPGSRGVAVRPSMRQRWPPPSSPGGLLRASGSRGARSATPQLYRLPTATDSGTARGRGARVGSRDHLPHPRHRPSPAPARPPGQTRGDRPHVTPEGGGHKGFRPALLGSSRPRRRRPRPPSTAPRDSARSGDRRGRHSGRDGTGRSAPWFLPVLRGHRPPLPSPGFRRSCRKRGAPGGPGRPRPAPGCRPGSARGATISRSDSTRPNTAGEPLSGRGPLRPATRSTPGSALPGVPGAQPGSPMRMNAAQ